jgi:trans-2,3-dihydro-3-hydroxyanthranilate isomerase
MVPLRDKAAVDRAITDASAVTKFKASTGLNSSLFVFTMLSSGPEPEIHSRMFAPEYGILEDPATGSAAGPLGGYLVRHGLVRGDAARRIVNFQGVAMGRPSRIHIEITERSSAIEQVRVGGEAVLIAKGELLV